MVSQFCWGALTSSQVQEIASLSKQDRLAGSDLKELDELEAIGTHGKHGNNFFRDIMRKVGASSVCPTLFARIPVTHKLLGTGNPWFPFLLPHELFACIFHRYPKAFFKYIAPIGEIKRFWTEVAGGAYVTYT